MDKQNKQIVSMVFSFRNEEKVLQKLIEKVENTINETGYEYELIFVNDASTDKSLKILDENRRRNDRIKIINMSRKFGVAPCIIAGYNHAIGEAVIHMDTDLQDPPEVIPKLIKKWEEGNDVVHTVRTKRKGESALKMFITRIAHKIIAVVSDIKILENSGNFKLISRKALTAILKLDEHDPFLRGLSSWVGFRQTQVEYVREARFDGETHFSILRTSAAYKEFFRGITTFSSIPLYLSLYLGFLISLVTFIYMTFIVLFGTNSSEWLLLIVCMFFLGGLILFAVGVQGIYIGMIYEATKRRPLYVIESKEGFAVNYITEKTK